MHRPNQPQDGPLPPPWGGRPGFTLVELLIVIAVIIILLSILVVGLNIATKTAQSANTQTLLKTISQGLIRFEGDMGYLPPILDLDRRLVEAPLPGTEYEAEIQNWFSLTSLGEYLVGYGHHNHDGYGFVPPSQGGGGSGLYSDEIPPTGIRHPGLDGVWGAGIGTLAKRRPVDQGRVYGPYIELDNPKLIAILHNDGGGNYTISRPGDRSFEQFDAAGDPKVILDFWGEPLAYYRRPYPPGVITQSYRAGTIDEVPTLSDFIRLRPYDLDGTAAVNGTILDASTYNDGAGDPSTTYTLESGEFALFSSGSDKTFSGRIRHDKPDDLNADNLVEVGP
ncbi:MAG: prepilin-type N-terminal cleavage/methylation domain-containing protein [Planctomycetes bacterium]|nr:prepilin-type N-terminal cleavage/methylation domain-containing protein [Planctomycetota bacterium]